MSFENHNNTEYIKSEAALAVFLVLKCMFI